MVGQLSSFFLIIPYRNSFFLSVLIQKDKEMCYFMIFERKNISCLNFYS